MFYLEATGPNPGERERWQLVDERRLILGRNDDVDCPIPWDAQVSRRHAELVLTTSGLAVKCFPNARNQLLIDGELRAEAVLTEGRECRVGDTTLRLHRQQSAAPGLGMLDAGVSERGTTTDLFMRSTDYRVAMVSKNVPGLWMSKSDDGLAAEAVRILKDVIPHADLLAVLECDNVQADERPRIVHWDKPAERGTKSFVSRRLIGNAVKDAETAIEVETDPQGEPVASGRWAFCVPVQSESSRVWCIYLGGSFGEGEGLAPRLRTSDLKADAALTELLAHLIGAIRHVRTLENRFAGVQQFFSPSVVNQVSQTQALQNLAPRETDVVVLFCDLRGFSRMVDDSSDDLHGLLRRISAALGVMTHSIIERDGVIADFQGDSTLGFWGWPIAQTDGPLHACRAALKIQSVFELAAIEADDDLHAFQVGIGLASGRAIAGRIGTRDQAKVGVFGSVVNIATRLEGMTKQVGVPILMDDVTAAHVRTELPHSEGRCRRVGLIQPAGFERPIDVHELMPPSFHSDIDTQGIANFNAAADAFESGDWERCRELLATLPAKDRARDFLLLQIATHQYQPPQDWNGVITLDAK